MTSVAYPKCMQCTESIYRFNHPVKVFVDSPEVLTRLEFCGGQCLFQYISNTRIRWY